MTSVAEVRLWGTPIGAVSLERGASHAAFEYHHDFLRSKIELAPLTMPLGPRIYQFPGLPEATFHGLPGLVADSLPDRFGNALIDAWLASQGRKPESFDAVERLCYIGERGMGALEFAPVRGPDSRESKHIQVDALVELASKVLSDRQGLKVSFEDSQQEGALRDILRVGTSAGGARAKALIAWNRQTDEVRSGQVAAGKGFDYWVLKFDGVSGNKDKELEDPRGYGAVEYAYSLMARAAGITMSECRLMEENGRRHFMTRRFDRTKGGGKLHMQSLCALAHYDFNAAGAYSYEQAFLVMRDLGLPKAQLEEQFRRMVFNVLARNQDDHVKNIAFLMNKSGQWSLSPAYDLTFSFNPEGAWTSRHQVSLAGKRDGFAPGDFEVAAEAAVLGRTRIRAITREVADAVARWADFADQAGVPEDWAAKIGSQHRLETLGLGAAES